MHVNFIAAALVFVIFCCCCIRRNFFIELQFIAIFCSGQNRPEVDFCAKGRHPSKAKSPVKRPTQTGHMYYLNLPCPSLTIFELLVLYYVVNADWERKSPLSGNCFAELVSQFSRLTQYFFDSCYYPSTSFCWRVFKK
jgi:hypothetical protein